MLPPHVQEAADPRVEAERLKNKGNMAFADKRYTDAIEAYTHCLALQPDMAVVYANRAAAHIKLKQFDRAEADCTEAINRDPQ